MKGKWKNKGNLDFPFFLSLTPRSQNVFFGRSTPGSGVRWKSGPCFFTKSVKFGFGELSIRRICAKSQDLQSGHGFGACSFKNKRNKFDFHTFGIKTTEQMNKNWRNRSNVGLRSSKWYQKDREGQRGYFRKIWAWKTLKNWKNKPNKIKIFSGFVRNFPVDSA